MSAPPGPRRPSAALLALAAAGLLVLTAGGLWLGTLAASAGGDCEARSPAAGGPLDENLELWPPARECAVGGSGRSHLEEPVSWAQEAIAGLGLGAAAIMLVGSAVALVERRGDRAQGTS